MSTEQTVLTAASEEQVAAWLSAEEGRVVTIPEVRMIVSQGLRKLRNEFARRGLRFTDLSLDDARSERYRGGRRGGP